MHEFGDIHVTNLGRARAELPYPMRDRIEAGGAEPEVVA